MRFHWSPFRIYYGWWIVGAVFLISAYAAGIIVFGFTAIIEPLVSEFGWSYSIVSFAASLRGLETGILAPLVGFLVDRWSPRKLLLLGVFIVGLGLVIFSRVNSIWTFYVAFVMLAIGVSFTGVVIAATIAVQWFRKNVSLATGIIISGSSFGGVLVPLMTLAIDIFGWRMAMLGLGIGAWSALLPLSLILRQSPEKRGNSTDQNEDVSSTMSESQDTLEGSEKAIKAKRAFRSRAFWHISLAITLHGIGIFAILTHIMPYLGTVGIDRLTASLVASGVPLVGTFGRVSFGWFGDRFDKRSLVSLCFVLTIVGILMMNYMNNTGTWILVLFVIVFGIGWGGVVPLTQVLIREYFGRTRFGTIFGMAMGIMMLGGMAGPPLAGWVFDTFGSYEYAWLACAGGTILGLLALLTMPSNEKIFGMNKIEKLK
ncbi:MFS transporter [Chloroflexota bacterium]